MVRAGQAHPQLLADLDATRPACAWCAAMSPSRRNDGAATSRCSSRWPIVTGGSAWRSSRSKRSTRARITSNAGCSALRWRSSWRCARPGGPAGTSSAQPTLVGCSWARGSGSAPGRPWRPSTGRLPGRPGCVSASPAWNSRGQRSVQGSIRHKCPDWERAQQALRRHEAAPATAAQPCAPASRALSGCAIACRIRRPNRVIAQTSHSVLDTM